jgi:hypothetical protein
LLRIQPQITQISQIFVVPLTLRLRPAPLVPGKPSQILEIGVIGGFYYYLFVLCYEFAL